MSYELDRQERLKLCKEVEREREPPFADLEREYAQISAIAKAQWEAERKLMDYRVDAGEFLNVKAVSPRDCAHLALTELGDRARFPMTVIEKKTGEQFTFVLEDQQNVDPGAPPPLPEKKRPRGATAAAKKARA